jgi:hypothetical protein
MLHDDLATAYLSWLTSREVVPEHMYQDHSGRVCTVNGLEFPHAFDAHALDWIVRSTGEPAPKMMVTADFSRVRRSSRAHTPDWYGRVTLLDLSPASFARALDAKVQPAIKRLCHLYPSFDLYPQRAQVAMIDLAINGNDSGAAKDGQSALKDAIVAGHWEDAAGRSRRPGVNATKNADIAKLFRDAALTVVRLNVRMKKDKGSHAATETRTEE